MVSNKVVIVLLTVPVIVSVPFFFYFYKPMRRDKRESHPNHTCSCYQEPVAGDNNIFFIESSRCPTDVPQHPASAGCGLRLSARSACAVEAAARQNPQRPIYVVHTCSLSCQCLRSGVVPAFARELLRMPNVHVWQVGVRELLKESPLAALYHDSFQRSKWPMQHASDLMRLVLLARFGGTYLDTDVYLLRPLGNLRNFVCVKNNATVTNAVMDFAMDTENRSIANTYLSMMREKYNPDLYSYNGDNILTDILRKYCGKEKFSMELEEYCGNFRLLPPYTFYPLPRASWQRFYEEEGAEDTMRLARRAFGVHVWRYSSTSTGRSPVRLRSQQPLAQLARDACPGVVASAADGF